MAEKVPPRFNEPPMRIVFSLPKNPPPTLKKPQDWTKEFNAFLSHCLVKDPDQRSSASQLLPLDFIKRGEEEAKEGVLVRLAEEMVTVKQVEEERREKEQKRLEEEATDDEFFSQLTPPSTPPTPKAPTSPKVSNVESLAMHECVKGNDMSQVLKIRS